MDSAVEKLGVYEFFCVFLSGLMFTYYCLYKGLLTEFVILNCGNETIDLITFLLFSYFCGLILQAIGSFVDSKCTKLSYRNRARRHYLNARKHRVFKNEAERRAVKELTNTVFRTTYTGNIKGLSINDKCEYVFQYCKTWLEVNGNITKVEHINSLYGLYRGMRIGCIVIAIISILQCAMNYQNLHFSNDGFWGKIISWAILYFVFRTRCNKYAEYRVRVIFRHYLMLEKKFAVTDTSNDVSNELSGV